MARYLTKSRFKIACECETKLYYTRKNEYADQSADNPFLMELAKGGYQVGELAKYYFTEDAANITVQEKGYDDSLEETNKRIARGDRYIAEAAILFENLFIRVDVFEIDKSKKSINIYEVKSKSWDSSTRFFAFKRNTEEIAGVNSSWESYLFDVAFQKYVVTKAFPNYSVNAFLTLVNKDAVATVDGLNQLFKVKKVGNNTEVINPPNLKRSDLGDSILINTPIDNEIDYIWNQKVESLIFPNYSFENYIKVLSDAYRDDKKIETPISAQCKKCSFFTKEKEENQGLKSGIKECWTEKLKISEKAFNRPRVTELFGLYGGGLLKELIEQKNKYFIDEIEEADIFKKPEENKQGLSWNARRWEQVIHVKENDSSFFLDADGLRKEMASWIWPLHFIDFETSSPALPFTKNAHPYEGIAFQYSHHSVEKINNGGYRIIHKNQFLNTEQGVNPNLDFIRTLKNDLSSDNGTIFRYHRHENTYLKMIYNQLNSSAYKGVHDREELLSFIDSITEDSSSKRVGERNMVDLWELVARYYYSPHTHGSTSLKKVLPAAINDSPFLKEKYSKPVCGINKEVHSRNFDSQIWIQDAYNNDPYKTLPPVFENYSREDLDEMFEDMDGIADGGAAMMAYAKLQFFNTAPEQREAIQQALYKYCELDTLAMVMLWEFWNEQVNN